MSQTSCGPAQSLDVQVAATLAAIAYLGKDDDREPVEQLQAARPEQWRGEPRAGCKTFL